MAGQVGIQLKEKADTLVNKLHESGELSIREFKTLLEITYLLLNDDGFYNHCLRNLCFTAEHLPKDRFIKQLLLDCIIKSRVFLYKEMLGEKIKGEVFHSNDVLDAFAMSLYTLPSETVLTKQQKELFDFYQREKRIVASAPTSFGKSRIISEIILSNNYQNAAVVLPTIALLTETYYTYKKNPSLSKYNLIVSTKQLVSNQKGNIFIFTPEKMDLYLDENPNCKIDFFVMDEIYKIQNEDERSKVFSHCLYRLVQKSPEFYLIGPYFQKFSPLFLKWANAKFIHLDAEIVQKENFNISDFSKGESLAIGTSSISVLKDQNKNLSRLLERLDGQSLVYVGNKRSVESKSKHISRQVSKNNNALRDKNLTELIEYIKETISDEWSLINYLESGVAFHHSGLPKYIQKEIVDAFNSGGIKIIVCSPTLIEGVNTSAKNVIFFDNQKGDDELTGFDVKNIRGRSGRFGKHFIGRVISFVDLPEEEEIDLIEFSYLDKKSLDAEEIILVDEKDLTGENVKNRLAISRRLANLRIPLELLKKNKFVSVESQINLIWHLRQNPTLEEAIRFNGGIPSGENFDVIFELCHNFLFPDKYRDTRKFTYDELVFFVKLYIYNSPTIKELIKRHKAKTVDAKVRGIFSLIADYFEFAIPRYLRAFENLFNFVYQSQISLSYAITKLEFGTVEAHEIALKETGMPQNLIRKVSPLFVDCDTIEEIKAMAKAIRSIEGRLSKFEARMFDKYI